MTLSEFVNRLPTHKCGLYLTHNGHKENYQTVAEAIKNKDHGYKDNDWISSEQKQLAIDTDECWALQWYSITPVGFYMQSAAQLESLIAYIEENSWD